MAPEKQSIYNVSNLTKDNFFCLTNKLEFVNLSIPIEKYLITRIDTNWIGVTNLTLVKVFTFSFNKFIFANKPFITKLRLTIQQPKKILSVIMIDQLRLPETDEMEDDDIVASTAFDFGGEDVPNNLSFQEKNLDEDLYAEEEDEEEDEESETFEDGGVFEDCGAFEDGGTFEDGGAFEDEEEEEEEEEEKEEEVVVKNDPPQAPPAKSRVKVNPYLPNAKQMKLDDFQTETQVKKSNKIEGNKQISKKTTKNLKKESKKEKKEKKQKSKHVRKSKKNIVEEEEEEENASNEESEEEDEEENSSKEDSEDEEKKDRSSKKKRKRDNPPSNNGSTKKVRLTKKKLKSIMKGMFVSLSEKKTREITNCPKTAKTLPGTHGVKGGLDGYVKRMEENSAGITNLLRHISYMPEIIQQLEAPEALRKNYTDEVEFVKVMQQSDEFIQCVKWGYTYCPELFGMTTITAKKTEIDCDI